MLYIADIFFYLVKSGSERGKTHKTRFLSTLKYAYDDNITYFSSST